MQFSIRVLVVVILIVVGFVIFATLIVDWGAQSGSIFQGLFDWLGKMPTTKP